MPRSFFSLCRKKKSEKERERERSSRFNSHEHIIVDCRSRGRGYSVFEYVFVLILSVHRVVSNRRETCFSLFARRRSFSFPRRHFWIPLKGTIGQWLDLRTARLDSKTKEGK